MVNRQEIPYSSRLSFKKAAGQEAAPETLVFSEKKRSQQLGSIEKTSDTAVVGLQSV